TTTNIYPLLLFFQRSRHQRTLHSFPTRRSSDLLPTVNKNPVFDGETIVETPAASSVNVKPANETAFVTGKATKAVSFAGFTLTLDRKSTRLNSSHVAISYAVFCLKKKKRIYMQV